MRGFMTILLGVSFASLLLLFPTGGSLLAQEEKGGSELEELRKQNEALKNEIEKLRQTLEELKQKKEEVKKAEERSVLLNVLELEREKKKAAEEALHLAMEQLRLQQELEEAKKLVETTELADEVIEGQAISVGPRPTLPETAQAESDRAKQRDSTDVFAIIPPSQPGERAMTRYFITLKGKELEDVMMSHGDAGLVALLRFEKAKVYRKAGMLHEAVNELGRVVEQNLSDEVTNAARWTLVEILQEQKKNQEAVAELEKIIATIKDTRTKKDALYGIINLSGDDLKARIEAIERLIQKLEKTAGQGAGAGMGMF